MEEKYENLQKKYDDLKIQLKRQIRKNRNENRRRYNKTREDAARSDVVNEIRNKSNNRINKLCEDLRDREQEIDDLQEECMHWKEQKHYTQQKYMASIAFAISNLVGLYFILRDLENCVC